MLSQAKYWAARSRLVQELRDMPLWFHTRTSYAQHGEDRFLLENVFVNRTSPGTYVDIGASHPVRISNTYLLYQMGWSGVVVEPIGRLVDLHKRWRPRDTHVQCLVGQTDAYTTFYSMFPSVLSTASYQQYKFLLDRGHRLVEELHIPQLTLLTIIKKYIKSGAIDFMSVDIEGLDWVVAQQIATLDRTLLPQCLCIECNDEAAATRVRIELDGKYRHCSRIGANLMFWNER